MTFPKASLSLKSPSLPGMCAVTDAVNRLSEAGAEARGAIYTRREVVDFILDLSGYTADRPLQSLRLMEPSFGGGDFLFPAIERLLSVWRPEDGLASLHQSIRAVEVHRETFDLTRFRVIERLVRAGLSERDARDVASSWLIHGDYLLASYNGQFDVVVGNPPYVRQELIADALMEEYRARYRTIYDRADLYIPFIERSLNLLADGGRLGFICADRWMKNRYGGPLRRMVAGNFRLRTYVDMTGSSAFHSEVVAYPAITIIGREESGPTRVARSPKVSADALSRLSIELLQDGVDSGDVREVPTVPSGDEPWIFDGSNSVALIRRLEAAFPTLEEAGCKVRIGVATGADKAFIAPFAELDVEPDRKLPLVMTRDIRNGSVVWQGLGVVNPFNENGGLVDLADYPRLRRYLEERKPEISRRHVAQKAPANWYRTIDRIYPALARCPKLLIPDIKGEAHIVFEDEGLYPHHNLYYITSETWDLKALQAVLLSGIARMFVATYSTKMRGGFLRFQAQYLRRIRLPAWDDVSHGLRSRLASAAESADLGACNAATAELYGLSVAEQLVLTGD